MALVLGFVIALAFLAVEGNAMSMSKRNECGGLLSGFSGTFTSPNYPNNYPARSNCRWVIQGQKGSASIEITFSRFNVEWGGGCQYDSVIIQDKNGNQIGKKHCGMKNDLKVTIPGDKAVVILSSDDEINESGFIAHYTVKQASPKTEPGSCNFDSGLCSGLSNVDNSIDNLDWTVKSGPTPNNGISGPRADHSGKGKYIFLNSDGQSKGEKGALQTQEMSGDRCVIFYYHMYSVVPNAMGTLNVYTQTSAGKKLVMSLNGNQGDKWKKAQAQIRETGPYKVIFEGVLGSYYSDIALDDIVFTKEPCQGKAGCGETFTAAKGSFTSPGYPSDYEDNLRCKWVIKPDAGAAAILIRFSEFNLELGYGNCGKDYVSVTDSNGKSVMQDRFCGYYYGGFALKVPGNKATVTFHTNEHYTTKGFKASYQTIASVSAADCDFNGGVCSGWSNAVNDNIDWSIGKGNTPSHSDFTGPESDVYKIGKYAYIESSQRQPGEKARLVSPSLSGAQCLTFYYSMNGQMMGTLSLHVVNGQGTKQVWKATGDHGKSWLKKSITVDGGDSYQVAFEGIVGESFTSDMAIDEISFTKGTCPQQTGCNEILTAQKGTINSPNYPSDYPPGVDCTWTIIPPPRYHDINVTLHNVDIENSQYCSKDFVDVKDATTSKIGKICGKIDGDKTINVNWHQAKIVFHSDATTQGKGFQASYKAFDVLPACGGQFTAKSGSFQSPNFPNSAPDRLDCNWEIIAPAGTSEIVFTFENSSIDDTVGLCHSDYVQISAKHQRKMVCGKYNPYPVRVSGNMAQVKFHTSHWSRQNRFKVHFTAV